MGFIPPENPVETVVARFRAVNETHSKVSIAEVNGPRFSAAVDGGYLPLSGKSTSRTEASRF